MDDNSQQQTGGPWSATLSVVGVAGLVVLVGLGLIYALSKGPGSSAPAAPVPTDQAAQTSASDDGSMMPDYVMAASSDTQMAYQFALDRPDAMMWMPCYCGCGGHSGHKSARNCFVKESSTPSSIQFDEHGASCAMCVSIALDTKAMTEEGRSLREIRDYIDQEYGGIGPGTDTPLPPG